LTENDLTNSKNLSEATEEIQQPAETPAEQTPVKDTATPAEEIANKTETVKTEQTTTTETEPTTVAEKSPIASEEQTTTENVESKDEGVFSTDSMDLPKLSNFDNGAHDDFDWDIDKKANQFAEDDSDMIKAYEGTFKEITEDEIISGAVVSITDSEVVLNIGHKSDGLISRSEFRDIEDLKVGSDVEVYVVSQEDERGQLVLSRKKAKLLQAWNKIVKAKEEETVVEGTIISKTKGGLIADVFGLETFLPGSQIDVKPIIDYDAYVGQTMEFKIVKINDIIKNAVVSHKALIESDLEEQRQKIIGDLEKGQVLEGIIKNITDFGAFIDLGGVDGLLYITDISWGRIMHPSEVLELNQKLNVVVLDYENDKKRISLGLKQLKPHPWDIFDETVIEGSTVRGKIVNIEDYGAFLEIEPGVEGLVHVSEVGWSNQPINSRDFFKLHDEHEAKVVTIDRDDRKMSLSIKQLSEDPWQNIAAKFPVGSKHSGLVKNITPYGVFVELNDGIGGMIHISDLSWTKRYNHPNEYTKVDADLDVIVLEIDAENRKLSLGHKQIEEDPWDTFENIFPIGSIHEGTVIKKNDTGGIVSLPYGVEAFAPNRHLKKEDETLAGADETMQFKVIEFNRDDKRIVISHTRIIDDEKFEERKQKTREKDKQRSRSRGQVKNLQSNLEKTTFGDLDVLAQLKQQMQQDEKKASQPEPASKLETVEDKSDVVEVKPETVEDKPDAVEAKPEAVEAEAKVEEKLDSAEEVKPEDKTSEEE